MSDKKKFNIKNMLFLVTKHIFVYIYNNYNTHNKIHLKIYNIVNCIKMLLSPLPFS